jgi:hypothetical protein
MLVYLIFQFIVSQISIELLPETTNPSSFAGALMFSHTLAGDTCANVCPPWQVSLNGQVYVCREASV